MENTCTRKHLLAAFALGIIAAATLLFANAQIALADGSRLCSLENPKGTITVFYFTDSKYQDLNYSFLGAYKTSAKVKAAKSSNKKVMTAKCTNNERTHYVDLHFKKPGKAKLTYKFKGKKHTVTFIVKKYKNPLKTFKIGKKNILSKFNKVYYEVAPANCTGELKVKAKSGWKITKIKKYTGSAAKRIKNGSKIGKGTSSMVLTVKHKKTGIKHELFLDFAV